MKNIYHYVSKLNTSTVKYIIISIFLQLCFFLIYKYLITFVFFQLMHALKQGKRFRDPIFMHEEFWNWEYN